MKVVCIKKYLSTPLQHELTYGKIYEVMPKQYDALPKCYKITNDRGFIDYFNKSIFITLEQWRELQIDKLYD